MKKLIVSAMVAALLAVMFASPVTATDYDPHKPPWAYLMQAGNEDSGDDNGFVEIDAVGPTNDRCILGFDSWVGPYVRLIFIGFLGTGKDSLDCNGNTGASSTQRGTGTNPQ